VIGVIPPDVRKLQNGNGIRGLFARWEGWDSSETRKELCIVSPQASTRSAGIPISVKAQGTVVEDYGMVEHLTTPVLCSHLQFCPVPDMYPPPSRHTSRIPLIAVDLLGARLGYLS